MGLLGPELKAASAAEIAAHVFLNVEQALREGFATVRDASGIDGRVAACVQAGLLSGPRIRSSPRPAVTPITGAHGTTTARARFRDSCGSRSSAMPLVAQLVMRWPTAPPRSRSA